MTTKHTPGPWEFRVYSGGCTIVSKHDAPGRSVRDWLKGVSVKVDVEINDDQSNASMASPDARLIAAAPETAAERDRLKAINAELVAAVRGVDIVYAELQAALPGIVNTPAFDVVMNAVKTARAAIAKAAQ